MPVRWRCLSLAASGALLVAAVNILFAGYPEALAEDGGGKMVLAGDDVGCPALLCLLSPVSGRDASESVAGPLKVGLLCGAMCCLFARCCVWGSFGFFHALLKSVVLWGMRHFDISTELQPQCSSVSSVGLLKRQENDKKLHIAFGL